MMESPVDPDLADSWTRHRLWSATANKLKQDIVRARTIALTLAVVAALAGVAAAQIGALNSIAGRVLAAVAGAASGLVPLVQRRTKTEHIRDWTRARSASEGLKGEVYRYLAESRNDRGGDTRKNRLIEQLDTISSAVGDLLRHTATVEPEAKPLPAVHDIGSYLQRRVRDQIDHYYEPTAKRYQQRVSHLRLVGDILGGVGIILGALAGVAGLRAFSPWVAVTATVAASITAHIAASRHDHQIVEFLRTAEQLKQLEARHRRGKLADSELIDACENVISVENQGWMTKWTTPD